MWVRILGDKVHRDKSVIFPSLSKSCLERIDKNRTKKEKHRAFELLRDNDVYFGEMARPQGTPPPDDGGR